MESEKNINKNSNIQRQLDVLNRFVELSGRIEIAEKQDPDRVTGRVENLKRTQETIIKSDDFKEALAYFEGL